MSPSNVPSEGPREGPERPARQEIPAGTPEQIADFLGQVTPAKRQRDAWVLLALYGRITGEPPVLARSAIGFGSYHYEYESGRSGDAPAAAFAPRKPAMTIYLLDGTGSHMQALAELGPHTATVGCLYIKDLQRVNMAVLEAILRKSFAILSAGTFGKRAQEGG